MAHKAAAYMSPNNKLRIAFTILALLLISGCATVDYDYPKEASQYIDDTDDTLLGRRYEAIPKGADGESGFYLLNDGIEALAVRLLMAEQAEKTLDAQYYLISDDKVGLVFIGALLQAADRGVRVRLLLDDIQTQNYDGGMAALDAHPNFEIRIFNPFYTRNARGLDFWRFSKLNRRMHNKSFTADNRTTIIGGRNIADEYFNARDDVNFGDLDVFGVGPVVTDVSTMFDIYWNHVAAVPVPGFTKVPEDTDARLAQLRINIQEALESFKGTQYAEAFNESWETIREDTTSDNPIIWADYELVYDSPDKSDKKKAKTAASIVTPLRESIYSAEEQLTIISPYFVPRKKGEAGFQKLVDKGIDISVITNSLAANNHAIVHSGYVPSRKPLLKMGVNLYEVKNNAKLSGVDRGGKGASLATVHTKAFLVDNNTFFLGSFNFDPRSAFINTELGVIIKSEVIGNAILDDLDKGVGDHTYKLRLNEKNNIEWVDDSGPDRVVYTTEPDTSWWLRFKVGFLKLMPIKSQL